MQLSHRMTVQMPNAKVLWPPADRGAGIQLMDGGKRLLLRWVRDDIGNRWGDMSGHEVHYKVPYADLPAVLSCKIGGNSVVLAVRCDDGQEYDYGVYTISHIMLPPSSSIRDHYTAVLHRKQEEKGEEETATETTEESASSSSESDDIYIVQSIVNHRCSRQQVWEFLVRWEGPSEDTWEPIQNFVQNSQVNHQFREYCRTHNLRLALQKAKKEARRQRN